VATTRILAPAAWLAGTLCFAMPAAGAAAAEFDCVIEPKQVLELRAPLEGLIDKVNADRGDYVRKGQVLAVLDSSVDEAQAEIARQRAAMRGAVHSAETRVEYATKKFGRTKDLQSKNFISDQARDEAATEKRLAEAELLDARDNRKLAELELKRQQEIIRLKSIRSPVDGVVTERVLNPGEFAEAGVGRKPIFKIAEIDTLYVEALLPVEAYGRVRTGMKIVVVPEIPQGARFTATLKVIDRVLDAASGTFGVRLELPNRGRKIPAGIRCKAEFPNVAIGRPAGRSALRALPAPQEIIRAPARVDAK